MNKKGVFGTKCSRCDRGKREVGTYCRPCRSAYMRDLRRAAKPANDLRKPRRTHRLTDAELDACARRGLKSLLEARR